MNKIKEDPLLQQCRERKICYICKTAGIDTPDVKSFRFGGSPRWPVCELHYEECKEIKAMLRGRP